MKILGRATTLGEIDKIRRMKYESIHSMIPIYSQTSRVMTQDGHLEFVQIQFVSPVDSDTIAEQLNRYVIAPVVATLPSTPQSLFLVQKAMPSPRQIGYLPSGMEIIIGDITQNNDKNVTFWTLSHNLRRGACWAGRQGLELYLHLYQDWSFE